MTYQSHLPRYAAFICKVCGKTFGPYAMGIGMTIAELVREHIRWAHPLEYDVMSVRGEI